MELWIRSQKGLYLEKATKVTIDYKSSENVYFIKVNNNKYIVGEYYSMERALEVLDEIQYCIICIGESYEFATKLKQKVTAAVSVNIKTNVVIYEMPEE